MSTEGPVWGSPDPAPTRMRGPIQDLPRVEPVQWKHTPAGLSRPQLDARTIQRQAGVALVVNLLVLFMALGLCSAPGAAMALRARSLAPIDPKRAQRSLMWSWLLLASNLVLYVLAVVVVVLLALSILTNL